MRVILIGDGGIKVVKSGFWLLRPLQKLPDLGVWRLVGDALGGIDPFPTCFRLVSGSMDAVTTTIIPDAMTRNQKIDRHPAVLAKAPPISGPIALPIIEIPEKYPCKTRGSFVR